MNHKVATEKPRARAVELWMVSNLAMGAATTAFLSLLVPPFVLAQTGSALRSGIVLAVVGLAAVSSPLWGKLADKHHAHRPLYLLSMIGMTLSFLILALDAGIDWYSPIFGILLGVSMAAQGTISSVFIIGADLPTHIKNRQITVTNLAMPLGQVVGAVAIALGQWAGFGYIGLFWLATIILAIFTVCTVIGIAKPVARLKEAEAKRQDSTAAQPEASTKKQDSSFRTVVMSTFGVFLLVVIVSSFSNNGMTSQIANIMPDVYGFTDMQTSALIALAGLLNLAVIGIFGKMMERTGPKTVYVIGSAIRFAGVLMMALVGLLASGSALVLAAIAMQLAFQGSPISRLPGSLLVARLTPVGIAEANGYYYGASALGAFVGCLVAGFAADAMGFNAVNWVAAVTGAIALALLCLWMLPATKKDVGAKA